MGRKVLQHKSKQRNRNENQTMQGNDGLNRAYLTKISQMKI